MYNSIGSINVPFPRIYRSCEEIKRDVERVLSGIREIREFVNVRELLSSMLDYASEGNVEQVVKQSSELYFRVAEAAEELTLLEAELDELKVELIESRAIFG